MMIRAVVFDMDGVLVNSEPKYLEQLLGFFHCYGADADDAFFHALVGSSYEYTYHKCIEKMQVDWSIEEFTEKLDKYVEEHPFRYDEVLNPGVKEILCWLKKEGYKTAIASSSWLYQIEEMVNVCGLQDYFDVLLSGEMFEESKPNPEIYLTAAKKLGVDPSECVAVEDSTYGIAAGNAAGMRVIAYADEQFGIDQSKAYAKIHSMDEVKKYVK